MNRTKFSDPDPKKVMHEMEDRITKFYNFLIVTGHLGLIRKSYQQYYSAVYRGGIVRKAGERGEIADLTTGDYRNLLMHVQNLVTGGRVKWDAKASNADHSSQAQTLLAPGLLDYYAQFKGLSSAARKAMEFSIWGGTGYVVTRWDETQGDEIGTHPDDLVAAMSGELEGEPRMVMSGDVAFVPKSMIDVVIDPTVKNTESVKWFIVRDYEQLDDMVACYPEHEDAINASIANYDPRREVEDIYSIRARMSITPTTCITWTLYHEKTASCPNGRILKMVGNSAACLFDEPLYTPKAPIARFQSSTIERTPLGYAAAWDILPLQQVRDIAMRTITTNVANTGVTNILNPSGSNIGIKQLRGGMNVIDYTPGLKPEALVLEATSPNVFNLDKLSTASMQTTMGVGDVQRGNPQDAGVKSGVALAMLQSLSVQFQSVHQFAWVSGNEKIGMDLLDTLRVKVQDSRKIAIVGKMPGQYMDQFTGSDLDGIERVTVDLGNPLMSTIAGRANIASEMLANGLIKDKDEYLQVLSIGSLEPAMQPTQAENMRIKSENEALLRGESPSVLYTDRHPKDIMEHLALLSTQDSRGNPQVIASVTEHVNRHMDLWAEMSIAQPSLMQILGIPPLQPGAPVIGPPPLDGMSGPPVAPPMPMDAGIGPMEGGPGGPPPGPQGPGPKGPPQMPPPPGPVGPEVPGTRPKNPATGKQWDAQTGGA